MFATKNMGPNYHQIVWCIFLCMLMEIADVVPGRSAHTSTSNHAEMLSSKPFNMHGYKDSVKDIQSTTTSIEFQLRKLNMTERTGLSHSVLRRDKRSLAETSIRMPGTNWCGGGWRAKNFEHLGSYGPTDKCCRQHDLGCPAAIQPGETILGLENDRYFTMMHCSCDERFRSCLKMVDTSTSTTVGKLFFNLMQTPCFVLDTETICTEYTWWGKCIKEEVKGIAVMKDPVPF